MDNTKQVRIEDCDGPWFINCNLDDTSIDMYRAKQMFGIPVPAGELFCRLGMPNPFGFEASAELHRVRMMPYPN